jgi:hypothetical protein
MIRGSRSGKPGPLRFLRVTLRRIGNDRAWTDAEWPTPWPSGKDMALGFSAADVWFANCTGRSQWIRTGYGDPNGGRLFVIKERMKFRL